MPSRAFGVGRRARAYHFLAAVFCERPDEQMVRAVLGAAQADPDGPGSRAILEFAAETCEVGEAERLRLVAVDRTRLFRGVAGSSALAPYESLFSGRPAAEVAADLAAVYARAGLVVSHQTYEAPDYFGVECAFAARLIENGDEDATRDFLCSHLVPFGAQLADDMESRARTGFFRGLAQMLSAFMEEERVRLNP